MPELPPEPDLGRSVFIGFEHPRRPVLLSLEADVVCAGARPLLRDVRVQLRRGEKVRLEGPNGAGKTRLIAALLARSSLPPDRLLGSRDPSPGETRKQRLALGLGTHAWALVLDDALADRCTTSRWQVESGRVRT